MSASVGHSPPETVGYRAPSQRLPVIRLSGDTAQSGEAVVAEEVPVALVYNGRPHAVMMATPADLEDFAAGFSLTETVIGSLAELERTEVVRVGYGIEVQCTVPAHVADELRLHARPLPGRGGCGLCGKEAIADVMHPVRAVSSSLRVTPAALWRAGGSLSARQALNVATHAVHAAAWATADGELQVVREDVGRHNALDKVIGALLRAGIDASGGFLVVTSRASYELVQKAAAAGVPLLAAVSRPTGLAVRMAQDAGMTLVALLRGESANVYAGAERIVRD
jgi:FdhD protein